MQAVLIASIILLPLGASKYYYGYMNEQNEKFTLFSTSKAKRDAELDSLLIEPVSDVDTIRLDRTL
jgi:hypothetical protein